jgi:hypothetical protein
VNFKLKQFVQSYALLGFLTSILFLLQSIAFPNLKSDVGKSVVIVLLLVVPVIAVGLFYFPFSVKFLFRAVLAILAALISFTVIELFGLAIATLFNGLAGGILSGIVLFLFIGIPAAINLKLSCKDCRGRGNARETLTGYLAIPATCTWLILLA